MDPKKFAWPGGARGALSLSWDDGRESQLSLGLPLLDSLGLKATFYLNQPGDAQGWKRALAQGHEIGNHTCSHPCSGNFDWSRHNALEDYDLGRMEGEMLECNRLLEQSLGTRPKTFAYPCGQAYVGRGAALQSTVPLVARHFLAGRAYLSEHSNQPDFCDLSLLGATGMDGCGPQALRQLAEKALDEGTWLILAGHEIGRKDQGIELGALEEFGRFLAEKKQGLWVDTIANVAAWVARARSAKL